MATTGSAYLVNPGGSNVLTVIDVRHCDAVETTTCRVNAPGVPDHEDLATIDPATNTIYASNYNLAQIDVLDGATCNSRDLTGCAPVAEIPIGHADAKVGAIDAAHHTLYAADRTAGTLSLVNTATCNAQTTAGCGQTPGLVTVGSFTGQLAVSPAANTIYAPSEARPSAATPSP